MSEREGTVIRRNSDRLTTLTAISPIDGRYRDKVEELAPFFSESGLIRVRTYVEGKYLIALSDMSIVRPFSASERKKVATFGARMTPTDTRRVKKIEAETRHDVKAMERVFREKLEGTSLEDAVEMVHFGLTSEDVNNLASRLILKWTTERHLAPVLDEVTAALSARAEEYRDEPMLARTHGQPAVPTTLGKEFANVGMRVKKAVDGIGKVVLSGKLNGAVGNYNALQLTHPEVDWVQFSQDFVTSLGLEPNIYTTQINPYEDVIELFQAFQRVNGVLIDFDQDMWRYISDDWFSQEVKKGVVGSSTMPQKVNPIDFENSEGNLGLANAMIDFFTRKLASSRLQRDLSDSTVARNFGTLFALQLLAYKNTLVGLGKVSANQEVMSMALNNNWAILTEGAQTLLREAGVEDAYELVKGLSRGQHIGPKAWKKWVSDLPVGDEVKKKLRKLTPETYIGLATELTDRAVEEMRDS